MSRLTHYRKDGIEYTKDDGGRIILAVHSGREIKLGQKVHSNGRFMIPDGVLGIVVCIHEPGENGLTSNIFDVWFEGASSTTLMKTKDLRIV